MADRLESKARLSKVEKNKANSICKDSREVEIVSQSRQTKMAGIGCDEDRCATRRARARVNLPTLLAGYNVTLTKNTEDKEKIASSSLGRIYRYRGIDQFERVSPLCSRPSPDFLPEEVGQWQLGRSWYTLSGLVRGEEQRVDSWESEERDRRAYAPYVHNYYGQSGIESVVQSFVEASKLQGLLRPVGSLACVHKRARTQPRNGGSVGYWRSCARGALLESLQAQQLEKSGENSRGLFVSRPIRNKENEKYQRPTEAGGTKKRKVGLIVAARKNSPVWARREVTESNYMAPKIIPSFPRPRVYYLRSSEHHRFNQWTATSK